MHYSDLSQTERDAIQDFLSDLEESLITVFPQEGGEVRGCILDFILAGSWANGTAEKWSDIDIITVLDRSDAFYHPNPKTRSQILLHYCQFNQRAYPLNRFVDMRSFGPASIIHQEFHPNNLILGFSLRTGVVYESRQDVKAILNI